MLRPLGWLGIELRHFVALDAVASEASFNGAATKLGYTQSAISQQIAALERAIGQKLIERPGGSQPARLTRAGEIVMEHAQAIGARLATAQADLQSLVAGDFDPLRLGFFGRGTGALMPGIVSRLQRTHPEIELQLSEARFDEQMSAMLRSGEVDISFIHLPLDGDEFGSTALIEDDYVLVVGVDSAAAARGTQPALDELAAMPMIGLKPSGKSCQLTNYFRAHNLEPSWLVGSDDVETIYAFVAAGFGSALLPRLATLCLGPAVTCIELDCGLPPRRIGVAWSLARGESGMAQAFVRAAIDEAARFTRMRLSVAS